VEFCASKHNLDDLENWSLHELIDIVQAFLHHIRPPPPPAHTPAAQHSAPAPPTSQSSAIGDAGNGKFGLVLTEDDWGILLSTPSVVGSVPA
jgi:hypothetical protein